MGGGVEGLRGVVAPLIDEVEAEQSCLERPVTLGFSGRLRKIFLLSAPIRTIFASLLEVFQLSVATCDRPFDYGTAENQH